MTPAEKQQLGILLDSLWNCRVAARFNVDISEFYGLIYNEETPP